MTRFRQALLDELRSRVDGADPAPARRAARLTRPRLAFGGAALAVAAVTTTVVAAQSGGTPAYAVTTEADGTVSVTVHRADDPADANRQLETADGRVVIMRMSDPADCPKADRGTLLPVGISDAFKRHKAIEEGWPGEPGAASSELYPAARSWSSWLPRQTAMVSRNCTCAGTPLLDPRAW